MCLLVTFKILKKVSHLCSLNHKQANYIHHLTIARLSKEGATSHFWKLGPIFRTKLVKQLQGGTRVCWAGHKSCSLAQKWKDLWLPAAQSCSCFSFQQNMRPLLVKKWSPRLKTCSWGSNKSQPDWGRAGFQLESRFCFQNEPGWERAIDFL